MTISELAIEIGGAVILESDAKVNDVTHDSRASLPGSVFVAIRGEKHDGLAYIPGAIALGAVAIISESDPLPGWKPESGGWIKVPNARVALAKAAAAVHDHPSRHLKLVGVTGTNGKTTTAHLIDSINRSAEGTSALFGTIRHRIGDQILPASHTTPEASDIQRMLSRAVRAGCRSAVMEVSSHAIDLGRAHSLDLTASVFTNLTRDHLDYHGTMDNYFESKKKLFTGELGRAPANCIINISDPFGRRLLPMSRGRIITYGFDAEADVHTSTYQSSTTGVSFTARTPAGPVDIESPLIGAPHVFNILAAVATGLALGFELTDIAAGVARCPAVPGRFEQVRIEGEFRLPFSVVVDYAHTDDALQNVLRTAREVAGAARVIVVFGCGGDRDRTKRAPMGEIAARLSDFVIVTSDNPRTEDPNSIISEIEEGLAGTGRPYVRLPDRRQAIFRAIREARESDIVVIAGKGHEDYQIIGSDRIPFDDREVAKEAMLERMRSSSN